MVAGPKVVFEVSKLPLHLPLAFLLTAMLIAFGASEQRAWAWTSSSDTNIENYVAGHEPPEFHVRDFGTVADERGIRGNGSTVGFSITRGNNTVTLLAATTAFHSADVGKLISIQGAGADVTYAIPTVRPGTPLKATSAGPLVAKITGLVDRTHVTISAKAVNSVTAASGNWGTDNYAAITAAERACNAITIGPNSRRGTIVFDPGSYAAGQTIQHLFCSERGTTEEQSAILYFGYDSTTGTQIPGGTQPIWQASLGQTQLSAGFVRDISFHGAPGWALDGMDFETLIDQAFVLSGVHVQSTVRDNYHIGGSWVNLQWEHIRGDGAGRSMFWLANPPPTSSSVVIDFFTYDNSGQPMEFRQRGTPAKVAISSIVLGIDSENAAKNGDNPGYFGQIALEHGRIETNYATDPGDSVIYVHSYASASGIVSLRDVEYEWFSSAGTSYPQLISFDYDPANTRAVNPYALYLSFDNFDYSQLAGFSPSFQWQGITHQYPTPPNWTSSGIISLGKLDGRAVAIWCTAEHGNTVVSGCSSGNVTIPGESSHAGQATCFKRGGVIGYCSTAVSSSGSCTCN